MNPVKAEEAVHAAPYSLQLSLFFMKALKVHRLISEEDTRIMATEV
jgi:hypothetical protein